MNADLKSLHNHNPGRFMHVWPQKISHQGELISVEAKIESPSGKKNIWFKLPAIHRDKVTDSADPLLIAVIFSAMREGRDIYIHGEVSPLLLENLEQLQVIWSCWRPEHYRQVSIKADKERERAPSDSGESLMAFSGGLDSSFTAWRHANGNCGRRTQNLTTGVMVHGFDIPLDQPDVFARAFENSQKILTSIEMALIPVSCNFREQRDNWVDAHGAAIASCLHLLGNKYACGLVASSHVYNKLRFPWGSTPLTDPQFQSRAFSILYDSGDFSRHQKAREVARWPEAMKRLRVCWEGEHKDRNCGICKRCVGTALCFAAEGMEIPQSLPVSSLEQSVSRLKQPDRIAIDRLQEILDQARKANIEDPWVASLTSRLRVFRTRAGMIRIKEALRRRFTSLSKRIAG